MAGVCVLVWEENRPWISALRQKGFSVPWVEEPKGDLYKQIPQMQPQVVVADLTRLADQTKEMLLDLAADLKGVPVILVSEKNSAARGLKGKIEILTTSPPSKLISAVRAALGQ